MKTQTATIFRVFSIAVLLITISLQLCAVPVNKRRLLVTQPDGSSFYAILHGDEFFHTFTDESGHAIIKQSDGYYCYAFYSTDGSKYSSGFPVGEETPGFVLSESQNIPLELLALKAAGRRAAMAEKNERPSILTRMKTNGISARSSDTEVRKKHSIIILAEFSDTKFTYTRDDFEALITQRGYSLYGAEGCAAEYFDDQFQGDYEFSFTVSDIVTLSNTCAYYFADKGNEIDVNSCLAVMEACELAHEAGVDFSLFDDDDDGEVDNVFLFVAGKDEADTGDEDLLWSHMYYLSSGGISLTLDGKKIDNYAATSEYRMNSDYTFSLTGIGTFCHEYSHTLGFVDLYDTDYDSSGGRTDGLWYVTGLMDGGNYNNNGNTPPHYNAIEYELAGLGNPEMLKAGSYSLEPISENRRYLKMETDVDGEYYLIECRNNSGWDAYIGGKGLLIYHIDRSSNSAGYSDTYGRNMTGLQRWYYNEVNCRPDHQCAELVPATAGISAFTPDGYLAGNTSRIFFPGGNTEFSPYTDPAFVFWSGNASSLAITDISISGDRVNFIVAKVSTDEIPGVASCSQEIFQDAAIIQWTADDPAFTGTAVISYGTSDGESTTVEVEPYSAGCYAYTIEGLSPRTAYTVDICFRIAGVSGSTKSVNFTTKSLYSGSYPYIYLTNADRNADSSFPKGAQLPLRVCNLSNSPEVTWYMDNKEITTSGNGYYEVTRSFVLKAVITYSDGNTETISKEIVVE